MFLRAVVALVLIVSGLGCTAGEVDLTNKRCPCTVGWTCVDDFCVPGTGSGRDAGGTDAAAMDARVLRDAAGLDASRLDTGPVDARVEIDAGIGVDTGIAADAGTEDDAGALDAGPVPSFCDETSVPYLFCDGFEMAGSGPWTVGAMPDDGVAERATDVVWRGAGALRARTTAASGNAVWHVDPFGGLASGTLHLRAYVRIPSGPALDRFHVLSLTPVGGAGLNIGVATDRLLVVEADTPITVLSAAGTLPRGRWFCLRAAVSVANAGTVRLWVDETMVLEEPLDTLPGAGIERLRAGVHYSSPIQGPFEVLIDDIAAGTAPLPCD